MPAVLLALAVLGASACNDSDSADPGSATSSVEAEPLATEPLSREQTAGCSEAAVDGSDEGWRRFSVDSGPFGFYGSGGGFARPGFRVETERGVKLPVVVAGDRRVIVAIAPADRDRVELQYGFTGERTAAPVSRIAFEPCADRDATSWPGGLRVSDTAEPVDVLIEVEDETEVRRLTVGDGRVSWGMGAAGEAR